MRVVKTWINSWATSSRFHEAPTLPCLFGCHDKEDRQSHYALCPFLFYLTVKLRPDDTPADPVTRIGVVRPSMDSLLAVSCTFAGYHAVKRGPARDYQAGAIDYETLTARAHRTFWGAFGAAAADCNLRCYAPARLLTNRC